MSAQSALEPQDARKEYALRSLLTVIDMCAPRTPVCQHAGPA